MSLEKYGIYNSNSNWNLSPEKLAEISINSKQAVKTSTGAITVDTGEFTGRSPKDRFIVKDDITSNNVWWGDVNIPFESKDFDSLYEKTCKYLENKEVYVRDVFACADQKFRLKIRVINEFPWSNLFAYNMFLRPSNDELKNFKEDWLILNVPSFLADSKIDGTRQHNFAIINFTKRIILIGGTGYTGEIKKGIFSALNFILPFEHKVLSMHCSANIGKDNDTSVFFGLSGTGKTTLSADPNRLLIGDDEHGWSDNSVFNFEGGCYAKCIDLNNEKEPDIFNAIKPGALLENIRFEENSNIVDFKNTTVTQNTRVSYPINHIKNIATPSLGNAPKNIFFLTCDAFGVLPPISKLNVGQAMYHFISGYTAKIAGTEEGINEPQTTFSACFGAPFLPLHPTKYATLLGEKLNKANINVWLVNTGWSGGQYGIGERISLNYTRAMISSALNGNLNNVDYKEDPIFGLNYPIECKGVPSDILDSKQTWSDKKEYEKVANKLANVFVENFEQYNEFANEEILASAPKIKTVAN